MKEPKLQTWPQLKKWLKDPQWEEQQDGNPRFAFRGQAASDWDLETSLARHFWEHLDDRHIHQWRTRELKMYQLFRERLIELCPGVYNDWPSRDIVALMQHYDVPTRFIDFTYSPCVAAWFALKDAKSASAIWIVDRVALDERRHQLGLRDYCGPNHDPYRVFEKDPEGKYAKVGSVLDARPNDRLAAQRGCFLVPGSISRTVDEALIYQKVILSERIAVESLSRLSELGSNRMMFPSLDALAEEVRRFSVTGDEHFPTHPETPRKHPDSEC